MSNSTAKFMEQYYTKKNGQETWLFEKNLLHFV